MSPEPNKVIYSMVGVSKFYDKRAVLKNIYLSYFYGAKIGVIGLNGSGKSSLLRIMAGVDKEINGEAVLSPGYTVGYLEQEPLIDDSRTVREVVEEAVQETVNLLKEFEEINAKFAEEMSDEEMNKLLERQGEVQEKLDHQGAWDLDARLEMAMDALRCPPPDTAVKILSGGERRRVALCRLLLQKPDILLLDEPTNHLDAESVAWLEHHLQSYPGTIIAVTHDRYFLDNVAGWILELDRGEGIPFKGNYTSWLEQKQERLRQQEKSESERQKTLQRELEWIRMSPKARQAKGKARITAYESLLDQEAQKRREDLEIPIPPGPRLGNVVIEAEGVGKGYGDNLLVDDMTFKLPPGGIVGVIGPNGAGKTTLFRMVTGQEQPDRGKIRIGETVALAYVDQSRTLDPKKSIWEEISGGADSLKIGARDVNSRAYVARFNFSGTDQQKKVVALSGGERNRVHLAKMLKEGANVLLLDEPTNDLDVNTLRALEEALENFAGCAVVISHDRWFLDRIATHILAFEGDSKVVWFDGNYSEYEADRKARLGAEAEQPHRIKYRPLTRG
jgi:energy-dependent translational throttle protein EttA